MNSPATGSQVDPPAAMVYLVTEDYGEWAPVAIYEALEDAKNLAPESDDWREDRGIIRNHGPGRDLFIQPITLHAARVAVVRPTREEVTRCISKAMHARFGYSSESLADAVLALFGVAVSDSQETPTKGREE